MALLYAVFFVSGVAALLFQTLWFRQAGLAFGNGVWASSLVLASFMAGLALGNALAARFGARARRPGLAYAGLEAAIAVSGVALVYGLPALTPALAPLLRPLLDHPALLNAARLAIAFALLLVPTTAMGATLPLLVKWLSARDANFGAVLGRLYGWNTLGAVAGALAGEAWLVERFGVRGTGLLAGGLDLLAAAGALAVARVAVGATPRSVDIAATNPPVAPPAAATRASRVVPLLLGSTALAGGVLLALEVVWFRFLKLFVFSGSLVFAVMLGVVLTGIGLGGFAGGAWLRRRREGFVHAPAVACLCGALLVLGYATFAGVLAPFQAGMLVLPRDVLLVSAWLMLPVALLSGVLFTFTGAAVARSVAPETRAAGLLTLANTVGSAAGSLLAGFVLLPWLGMERSFFLLATLYGGVALVLVVALASRRDTVALAAARSHAASVPRWLAAAALVAALLFFPSGLMEAVYFAQPRARVDPGGASKVVALREGRTETVQYLESERFGTPVSHQLLTDGFSMSGSAITGRRYMKLFVYWPLALRPESKRALLISYGVGSTAKALTDSPGLERIDVVDISREILELGRVVFPEAGTFPLDDPRVRVHVEDGRFFLQTTGERYDLITAEPPPPKNAGVVNLYTREYFALLRERLVEGGLATYWLPVYNVTERDTKSIVRAWCDVFADCTLWVGADLNWMLAGSRDARFSRSAEEFSRQWAEPRVAAELRALAFEEPAQIGALFLGDARSLAALTEGVEPLTDDFPKRIEDRPLDVPEAFATYAPWMDSAGAHARFETSGFVAGAWPAALRETAPPLFEVQAAIERASGLAAATRTVDQQMRDLHGVLTRTELRTAVLWILGTTADELRAVDAAIARGEPEDAFAAPLAHRDVSERRFYDALRRLLVAQRRAQGDRNLLYLRIYLLCLSGRVPEADTLVAGARSRLPNAVEDRAYWAWMAETFGLRSPFATRTAREDAAR